jgi:hypothetical protein
MTRTTQVTFSRAHNAIYWGLVLSTGPLLVFAQLLHRHTHHRPLGAVTFVLGATAVWVVAAWVVRRCKERGGATWHACRAAGLISALVAGLTMLLGG